MYKSYPKEDFYKVTEECAQKVRRILLIQLNDLEERREAINDRYPFEDLYLQQAAVDDESEIIRDLLHQIDITVEKIKLRIDAMFIDRNKEIKQHKDNDVL